MPREKDTELIKVIHLRISARTETVFKQRAKVLGISEANLYRLALAMFIRRGGVDYKEKDD